VAAAVGMGTVFRRSKEEKNGFVIGGSIFSQDAVIF
jgi:hypothetical protein